MGSAEGFELGTPQEAREASGGVGERVGYAGSGKQAAASAQP